MKLNRRFKTTLQLSAAVFSLALLFSACKKSNDDFQQTPVAGLMAFNLAPDKDAIGISLSGNVLTNSAINYTNYTGVYQPVFPGLRDVAAFDFNAGGRTPFAVSPINFAVNKYYSSFTVGANGTYSNVVVEDKLDSLAANDKAHFRFVNAITDSLGVAVSISAGSTPILTTNAAFKAVSEFRQVTPGEITIGVNNESTISATRTITLAAGNVYTILLVGMPGSTQPEKAVQIKFITNGSID